MAVVKIFLVAFGVVSVGASECTNTTLQVAKQSGDVAVDSKGNVWFTANLNGSSVYYCPKDARYIDGACVSMGIEWNQTHGIAVDDSGDFPVVYVSEGDDHAPKVKQCTWNDHVPFACWDFGSGWSSPRGLAVDNKGNVFIANANFDRYGVWKCSRSADCTLVGDSDHWPSPPPGLPGLAADSQGNVYVMGSYESMINYIKKCTSTGSCSDFNGDWPTVGGPDDAIAVGPDDSVYISHSRTNTLYRCSPDNICENVGAFDGVNNMVIDQDGVFYAATDDGLRRICLSPSIKGIQV